MLCVYPSPVSFVLLFRLSTMDAKCHGKVTIDKIGVKLFSWKRKRVTEAVFNQRISQVNSGKKRRKTTESSVGVSDSDDSNLKNVQGKRLIDIETLSKNLMCSKCQNVLSLCDIEGERRMGLASVFKIQDSRRNALAWGRGQLYATLPDFLSLTYPRE